MREHTFRADKEYRRADACLCELLGELTRSAVKKLFDGGEVAINGRQAKASQGVSVGDEIICTLPDPKEYGVKPENIPIDIVYEDDDIALS